MDEFAREKLEREWLTLTRETLPTMAARDRSRDWPVRLDHCFQRIILDNCHGGVWYDFVKARPAYKSMSDGMLARAVRMAQDIARAPDRLSVLNARSLEWRRAARRRQGRC